MWGGDRQREGDEVREGGGRGQRGDREGERSCPCTVVEQEDHGYRERERRTTETEKRKDTKTDERLRPSCNDLSCVMTFP